LSRSTYFSLKKALKSDGRLTHLDVPEFTLTGRAPELPDIEAEARAKAEYEHRRTEQKRIEQQEEQEYRDLEDRFFNDDDGDDDD
jgi:hypothetical protein